MWPRNGALKYGSFGHLWEFANFTHNMRLEMEHKGHHNGWYRSAEHLWHGTVINDLDLESWAKAFVSGFHACGERSVVVFA